MQFFFSSIHRLKEYLISVDRKRLFTLAVVVVFSLIIAFPYLSFAQENGAANNDPSSGWISELAGTILSTTVGVVAAVIMYVISIIAAIFITIAVFIIEVVIFINSDILNSAFVQTGFPITLAIANLGFVIALIVMAIGTILRTANYGLKQMLFKLVAAAIFVNFSLVIAGGILRIADQFTFYFIQQVNPTQGEGAGGTISGIRNFASGIAGAFGPQRAFIFTTGKFNDQSFSQGVADVFTFIPRIVLAVVFLIGIFIVLGVFIAMLLYRYIMLAFLIILMPLAWLMWLFKGYEKYWSQWWEQFTRWTVFGPIVMFFLWLAIRMSETFQNKESDFNKKIAFFTQSQTSPIVNALNANLGPLIADMLVPILNACILIGMMIGGMILAEKMGIELAKSANGAFDKVTGTVKGAVKSRAQSTAKRAGAAALGGTLGRLGSRLQKIGGGFDTSKINTSTTGGKVRKGLAVTSNALFAKTIGSQVTALGQAADQGRQGLQGVKEDFAKDLKGKDQKTLVSMANGGGYSGIELIEILKALRDKNGLGKVNDLEGKIKKLADNGSFARYGEDKTLKQFGGGVANSDALKALLLSEAKKSAKEELPEVLAAQLDRHRVAVEARDQGKSYDKNDVMAAEQLVAAVEQLNDKDDPKLGLVKDLAGLIDQIEKDKTRTNIQGKPLYTDKNGEATDVFGYYNKGKAFDGIKNETGIEILRTLNNVGLSDISQITDAQRKAIVESMRAISDKPEKIAGMFALHGGNINTLDAKIVKAIASGNQTERVQLENQRENSQKIFAALHQNIGDSITPDKVREVFKNLAQTKNGLDNYEKAMKAPNISVNVKISDAVKKQFSPTDNPKGNSIWQNSVGSKTIFEFLGYPNP